MAIRTRRGIDGGNGIRIRNGIGNSVGARFGIGSGMDAGNGIGSGIRKRMAAGTGIGPRDGKTVKSFLFFRRFFLDAQCANWGEGRESWRRMNKRGRREDEGGEGGG